MQVILLEKVANLGNLGDKVKVRAPRGTMEFKILEIVQ